MSILSSTRPTLGVAIIAALFAAFTSPNDDDRLSEAPIESVSPEPAAGDEPPLQVAQEQGAAAQPPGFAGKVRHLLAARLERMEVDASR